MEHHPCCLITSQGKLTLQQQGREAALISGHQVGGPEPNRQWDFRVVQNRSGRHRNLMPTIGTLPTPLLRQFVRSPMSTSRANEDIRPATASPIASLIRTLQWHHELSAFSWDWAMLKFD